MGLPGLLQRTGGGDGTGDTAGVADLQPVVSVHAVDGVGPGPPQRSDQESAELFIPGRASRGKQTTAHSETGSECAIVKDAKGLLRSAEDAVGGKGAAGGI